MEPTVPYSSPNQPGIFNPKNITILVILLIVLAGAGYYFYNQKDSALKSQLEKIDPQNSTSPINISAENNKAIGQVGQEIIYQSDLDTELAFQPSSTDSSMKKRVLDKIATDSAILQGTRELALITLDDSVFNSPLKDYTKRVKLVREAKEKIENEADSFAGTIVTIWFLNGKAGALGYEKAKQIAFEKISKLQADVKSGAITIQQAAESVKNDSQLAQIDPAYKTNASLDFKVKKDERITSDLKFNEAIFKLTEGETTDIFTGSSPTLTGNLVETRFHFAQLSKRTVNDKFNSFENWLEGKRKVYAVTYY